jgi:hypothetical protein
VILKQRVSTRNRPLKYLNQSIHLQIEMIGDDMTQVMKIVIEVVRRSESTVMTAKKIYPLMMMIDHANLNLMITDPQCQSK